MILRGSVTHDFLEVSLFEKLPVSLNRCFIKAQVIVAGGFKRVIYDLNTPAKYICLMSFSSS